MKNQKGFASIVIAIILVLVLSLITVGFAQLMRREQRNSLDKQLSNQAYYAAESGLNDATKAINSGYTGTKTSCGPLDASDTNPGTDYIKGPQRNIVNADKTNASYTCLLIDPTPQNLQYNLDNTDQPRYVEITGVDNTDPARPVRQIGTLVISWEDSTGGHSFAPDTNYRFKPAAGSDDNWQYTGLLKVGLTPLTGNGINRSKLVNDTFMAFLFPNSASAGNMQNGYSYAGGINGSDGTSSGLILNGNCNSANKTVPRTPFDMPRDCNVKIDAGGQSTFLMTLAPIYKGSNVTITAYDPNGTQLRIKNAQTLVDSTGKAQDVLRRIQVRVPTRSTYDIPDGTYGNICKQLQLSPGAISGNTQNCPIP